MTQRPGGFDRRSTETQATYLTRSNSSDTPPRGDRDPLGSRQINGLQSFSCAIDTDLVVLLSGTAEEGISAFIHLISRRS